MPLGLKQETETVHRFTVTPAPHPPATPPARFGQLQRFGMALMVVFIAAFVLYLAVHGWNYYQLGPEERPHSPLHAELRSSGVLGVKLGMLGVFMFAVLFLYPLRKRWRWLAGIGTTRRWLNLHVVMGISAPLIITFHSSFKFHGLAGLAYWIMVSVALSGFIGRYVYAQIPRSLTSAKQTLGELRTQVEELSQALHHQRLISAEDLRALFHLPAPEEVRSMSLLRMFALMTFEDVARFFRIGRLRRRLLTRSDLLITAGGLLTSRHHQVEAVIAMAGRYSWLETKMAFLQRTERIFHLWHVIHRPFSISFVVLVVIHISVIVFLGYY